MKPVKLALIAEHYHPTLSGASERFRRLLPGLRQRGIETSVFTVWHEGLEEEETIDGTTIHRLVLPPSKLHPSAELTRQVLRYFRATRHWPDLVHILSHTLQGIPFLWQMRLRGLPCTHSITMAPDAVASSRLGRVKHWLHQWLRYGVFNQVIVSSQVIAASARRCGVSSRRIKIIANGADTTRFFPLNDLEAKTNLRRELGLDANQPLVLFVGYISQRKGIDLLLEAWPEVLQRHPDARLLLIGPYERDGSFTQSFEENLHRLVQVTYLQPVDHIEKFMQVADVLVLPSRLEGMPNVVVEGMACGLPCVLTPFKGLPDTFGQPGVHYILTTFQPAQIAADIGGLLADENHRKTIGNASLKKTEEVLNARTSINQHAELFYTVTKKNAQI